MGWDIKRKSNYYNVWVQTSNVNVKVKANLVIYLTEKT